MTLWFNQLDIPARKKSKIYEITNIAYCFYFEEKKDATSLLLVIFCKLLWCIQIINVVIFSLIFISTYLWFILYWFFLFYFVFMLILILIYSYSNNVTRYLLFLFDVCSYVIVFSKNMNVMHILYGYERYVFLYRCFIRYWTSFHYCLSNMLRPNSHTIRPK